MKVFFLLSASPFCAVLCLSFLDCFSLFSGCFDLHPYSSPFPNPLIACPSIRGCQTLPGTLEFHFFFAITTCTAFLFPLGILEAFSWEPAPSPPSPAFSFCPCLLLGAFVANRTQVAPDLQLLWSFLLILVMSMAVSFLLQQLHQDLAHQGLHLVLLMD